MVLDEIEKATPEKARKLKFISKYQPQILPLTDEVEMLATRYIAEEIIPERKKDDAFHIAFTTAYELDALVSWNYKHLVNLRKKEMVLSVNLKEGYLKSIEMITPMEVIEDED